MKYNIFAKIVKIYADMVKELLDNRAFRNKFGISWRSSSVG